MSRNKLFSKRMELCLTQDQYKIVKELAKKSNVRMNALIRELIMEAWEKV